MKTGHLMSAVVLAAAAAATAHGSTIATFADPTTGPAPSLFQWNAVTSTLTGGWSGTGLNLLTPSTSAPDYADAKFTVSPLVATSTFMGIALFGAGSIDFTDSANNLVFKIEFDSAMMTSSLSFGGSDFVGFNVRFSGSLLDFPTQNEAFAFSFANPVSTQTGFTVTSSFTSSADQIVPAPGAMALMGLGGLLAIRRKRN